MKQRSLLLFACIAMARCVRSFHVLGGRNNLLSSTSFVVGQRHDRQQYRLAQPPSQWMKCRLFQSSSEPTITGSGKKRIVFLGTPEVAATTLRTLYQESQKETSCFEIVGVVTQPPKRRKRKGKLEQSPVGLVAEEFGLNLLFPEKAKDPEFLDDLEHNVQPDLCITAAYGQYLPKRFLATPSYGTVNIHPSLLPRWRGASPVQRSLEAGDNPIGVTVLFTVSKMDAGPIVSQTEHTVADSETATTVLPYLFEVGTNLLLEALPDLLSGKITMDTATPQEESKIVNADMIDAAEGEMKPWEETARTLHNRLRGFSMWPGATLHLEVGEGSDPTKFKILETQVLDEVAAEPTDRVEPGPTRKDGLRVVCVDGSILEVNLLQPATKKPMDALSFVNGLQGKTVRWVRPPANDEESSTVEET